VARQLAPVSSVLRTASAMLNPNEDCINWPHLPDDLIEELNAIPQQEKLTCRRTHTAKSQRTFPCRDSTVTGK
jgi:hypothetical protein